MAWERVVQVRNESSTPKLWRNPFEATGRGSMARQRWKKREPCLSPKLGEGGRERKGRGGMGETNEGRIVNEEEWNR